MKINKTNIKLWKVKIYIVCKEIFHFALFTYLIMLIAEMVKQGIVSNFFNINILLGVVFITGFVMAMTKTDDSLIQTLPNKKISRVDIGYSIILAIFGGFFVYGGTFDLGNIAILVGCLAGILILFLSLLLQIT